MYIRVLCEKSRLDLMFRCTDTHITWQLTFDIWSSLPSKNKILNVDVTVDCYILLILRIMIICFLWKSWRRAIQGRGLEEWMWGLGIRMSWWAPTSFLAFLEQRFWKGKRTFTVIFRQINSKTHILRKKMIFTFSPIFSLMNYRCIKGRFKNHI